MSYRPGNEPGEDFDVGRVHGQLLREKSEPTEIYRAAPGWLKHGIYAPLLIWGLWYLVVASGGFRWGEYSEGRSSLQRVNQEEFAALDRGKGDEGSEMVEAEDVESELSLAARGEAVYQAVCMACHQPNGQGLPGAFPPLASSDWVMGDPRRLALLVLHGLQGPIEVNGQAWNGVMPGQGATLDDEQIASVLSYVRSAWGNGAPEVGPEVVSELRERFTGSPPWTAQSLDEALAE